jgi:hypothetical protein
MFILNIRMRTKGFLNVMGMLPKDEVGFNRGIPRSEPQG